MTSLCQPQHGGQKSTLLVFISLPKRGNGIGEVERLVGIPPGVTREQCDVWFADGAGLGESAMEEILADGFRRAE